MSAVYVSNHGNDKNDGLTKDTPVQSWQRVKALGGGNNEIRLLEGNATLVRLTSEIPQPRQYPE